jgi:hypothetical protein
VVTTEHVDTSDLCSEGPGSILGRTPTVINEVIAFLSPDAVENRKF